MNLYMTMRLGGVGVPMTGQHGVQTDRPTWRTKLFPLYIRFTSCDAILGQCVSLMLGLDDSFEIGLDVIGQLDFMSSVWYYTGMCIGLAECVGDIHLPMYIGIHQPASISDYYNMTEATCIHG
jgi:hypothetical protein